MAHDGYQITIDGLLRKRAEMVGDIQRMRERLAVVSNDVTCLDRVLQALGYEGPLDGVAASGTRVVLFQRNELQQQLLHILRMSRAPMTSREIAAQMVAQEGRDTFDRRLVLDVIKRSGKTLGILRRRGQVSGGRDEKGRYVWRVKQ